LCVFWASKTRNNSNNPITGIVEIKNPRQIVSYYGDKMDC
jgi:hypothetical protein